MAVTDTLSLFSTQLGNIPAWAVAIIIIWSLVWKGLALWKSARLSQPIWFVLILVLNTLGILEILYIFIFSRLGFNHLALKKRRAKR
ncbi:MAG: DUF5652 family protein [Candidatus Pacearchaeota archaeon]